MADFDHMANIIHGEVIRITERVDPAYRESHLRALRSFLTDCCIAVDTEILKAGQSHHNAGPVEEQFDYLLSAYVPAARDQS